LPTDLAPGRLVRIKQRGWFASVGADGVAHWARWSEFTTDGRRPLKIIGGPTTDRFGSYMTVAELDLTNFFRVRLWCLEPLPTGRPRRR
jgi:hypothetical protein